MKKVMIALALLASCQVNPAFAQTIVGTNLPTNGLRIDLSDGTSKIFRCDDCPFNKVGLMNLEYAQSQGYFIPPGYVKEQPPAIIIKKGGANVESQVMIGVGSAIVVGLVAYAIWGREGSSRVTNSGGRSALSFKLN